MGVKFIADIGYRVHEILKEKHLTAAALGKYANISTGNISDWKRKGTNPSSDRLALISEFLGVSLEYLMTGKEKSSPPIRDDERELLKYYNALPELERGKILARLEDKAKEADVLPGRVG